MVQLLDSDIRTRDVLAWRGLHVFHARGSSCSQKLRIFLNRKGVPWESHPVDLQNKENLGDYYLGINPRGLVPAILHDGRVHIESNDIILHIEGIYPTPPLIPPNHKDSVASLLRHEDDLHMDLRTLTFRFMLALDKPPKSAEDLERYANRGSGTVRGQRDAHIDREISFWSDMTSHGITDEAARASAHRFRAALEKLDKDLARMPYLLGAAISILDIAWFVYVVRLRSCGYPVARLHPRVHAWAEGLAALPDFAKEVALPQTVVDGIAVRQRELARHGQNLEQVAGFA